MNSPAPLRAADILDRLCRDAFAPPERLSVSEWAERFRRIKVADRPGPWLNARTPYLVGPMDAVSDPSIRRVTVMKSPQVGGTELIYNALFWMIDQRPGPVLYVYPNQDLARKWNKRRFLPTVRDTPRIAARLGTGREDINSLELVFDRMVLYFAGSNSRANVEGLPARAVLVDELDRCEEGTGEFVSQRVSTYADSKIIEVSSPEYEEVGIDAAYRLSDRRRYAVPCPHCGAYDTREWEMVRWDGGLAANPVEVGLSAWIVCRFCREKITADKNLWQLERGRWRPEGWTVTTDGVVTPPANHDPRRPHPHAGFHITGLDSSLVANPPNPYGRVARAFVEKKGRPDQRWYNLSRGFAWTPKGESLEVGQLRQLAGPAGPAPAAGKYRLGTVPDGVILLTAAIDVQADGCYVQVSGWGPGGRDKWLIDFRFVPMNAAQGLSVLDPLLEHRYPRASGVGSAPIVCSWIDTGHRTADVYQWCQKNPRRRRPVKGHTSGAMNVLHRHTTIDKLPDGRPMPNGLKLLIVNAQAWTDTVVARLRARLEDQHAPAPAPGTAPGTAPAPETQTTSAPAQAAAPMPPPPPEGQESHADPADGPADVNADQLQAGPARRLWIPENVPGAWLAQMTAEHKVPGLVGGRRVMVWKLRPGRTDNHALDCSKYEEAGADALGVRRLAIDDPTDTAASHASGTAPAPKPPPRAASPGLAGPGFMTRG